MWNNLLALSGICLFSMNLLSSSKSMEFPNKFTDRQTRHLRAFAPHKFTSNTTLLTVGTWKNQKNTKNENFREIITKKWRTERGEQCKHSEHLPNTNANSSIKIRQFGRKAIIEKLNSDNTRRTRNSYKSRWMSSSNDTNVNNIRTADRSTLYKSLENSIPIRNNITPTDEYSTQVFNSRLLVGNGCVNSACGEIRGLKKSTLVVDILDHQRAPRWRRKAKNFMAKVKNRTPFDNRINGNLIRRQRNVLKEKRDFDILKKIGRVRPNMYATKNAINVNFRTLTKSNSKNEKFFENFEAAFGYILPRMTQSEKYYTANRTSSPYNHAKGSKISSYFDRENFDQHRRPKRYSKTNTVTANPISTIDLKFSSITPVIQMEINEKKFDKTEDDLTTLRWENYKNNFKKEITIDNTTVKSWRRENPSNLWSKNLVLENAAEIFEMNRSKSEKLRRLSASCHARDAQIAKKTIFILGLFALTNGSAERAVGHSEMTAASLAIKHINQMQILGCEYELQMLINNTQEDPGVALNNFFYAMYKDQHQKKIKALLGSSNAEVTHALAKITLAWDIPTISFGSSSPQLSDNKKYPMFFRTVAPDSSHNQARIAFLHFFKWNSIITICQQEDLYSWGINDLSIKLEQSNITQEKTISFSEQDFKAHLKIMPEQDSKIIVASFSEDVAPKFFCTVYDMGLYGGDYVWILPAASQNRWWNTNEHCSKQKLIKAVNGLILISSKKQLDENEYAISFMSEKEFQNLLPKLQSEFVREAYDAVWAAALSLNRTLLSCTEENIDCLNKSFHKSFQKQFVDNFQFIQFKGTSGPILFHGADRICVTNFYQIQDGELFPIAQYNPMTLKLNFSCSKCKDIIWPSGYIPVSKRTYELHIMNITPVAFYVINSFAVLGILVSLCFLVFNIYYREQKYIKLSSPYLNATTIVGCILVYLAVIFLGIDTTTMPAAFTFQSICTARVTLLSTGCSLAFGSIFAKTYRVHQIFIKSNHGILKSKVLQDSRLVPIIGVFVLIDGVIIVIWTAIDPMEHDLYNLTLEASASHPEIIHQIQVEVCKSEYKNTWLFALGIYKAIFFILGLYMAWETRNVKIPSLNDSEYIGLTVYTVLVTTVLHFTLANVTSDRITLGYVTTTSLILFTTTSSMCLLFLPKISAIYKSKDTTQKKIVSSADLKIESNTIRFVKNDDQEPYYRVHIQNFAYRKYVAFLDREIQNLHYKVYIKSNDDPDLLARRATKIYDKLPNLRKYRREKSSSLCGGIPNLFMLAVCPVVIPRASWPYAEHLDRPITEEMSFSSETKLQSFRFEETNMIDCNHRDSEDEDHEKCGGSIPNSPLKRLFDADEYQDTSSDVEEDHNHPNSILKICKAIVHSPLSDDELKTIEQTPTITITDTEIPSDDNNQQKEEIQQLEI